MKVSAKVKLNKSKMKKNCVNINPCIGGSSDTNFKNYQMRQEWFGSEIDELSFHCWSLGGRGTTILVLVSFGGRETTSLETII